MDTPFAQGLRALRQKKALTQSELARCSGLGRRTVGYWEAGRTQPRLPELQSALAALRATPDEAARLLSLLSTPRSLRLAETTLEANAPASFVGAHIGDLLRAIRMRRGMTQEELGDRLRINRLTVVRWETLRSFPSEESLARLCLALDAYPEEAEALRHRLLAAPLETPLLSLEECVEAIRSFSRQVLHMETPLIDLDALILKRRLAALAAHSEEAVRLLSMVELEHSSWLYYQNRIPESRKAIWRCLKGVRDRFAPERFWASALCLAAIHAKSAQAGCRLLNEWLPRMPENELRTYLLCDMALKIASKENQESTNTLLSEAVRANYNADEEGAITYLKITSAQIRMRTQGSVEALEWLLELGQTPDQRLAYYSMWINALLAAGDKRAALSFMTQAQTDLNAARTPHIINDFAALAGQL